MNHLKEKTRYTLAILFAINLLNFYDRNMFGAVAEPIRKEWGLNDSQIGWLATAFTLLYALVGVPLGRLADRWKRPRLLGMGVAAWSLLTAASGIAWSYGSLFVARLGVGVGEAACAPAANSLIGDLYPAVRRSRALSFFMLGLPLGNFLGILVSGRVAAIHGWRMAFFVACLPGLLLAVLAVRVLDPPRGAAEDSPSAGRAYPGSPYWSVLRIPTIRWIIITGALFNFNMYAVSTFLPAHFQRYYGLSLAQSNTFAAIVYGLTGVLGLLFGGWAADRASAIRPSGRLTLGSAAMSLSTLFIFLALNQPPAQLRLFVLLMGVGCMLCYVYYSTVYATIQEVVPPSLRGTAMALYFFVMYVLGGSFGPVITGKLSDHFAKRAMVEAGASGLTEHIRAVGLHNAMYVIPACSALLVAVMLGAAHAVSKDMSKMQAWMSSPEEQPLVVKVPK